MPDAPQEKPLDALALLRDAGRVGCVSHDAATGEESWDAGCHQILGRDPARGVPPGGLLGCIHQDDLASLAGEIPWTSVRCRLTREDGTTRRVQLLRTTGSTQTLIVDDTDAVDDYRARWESESAVGQALAMAGVSIWQIDLTENRVYFGRESHHILGSWRLVQSAPLDVIRARIHPEDRHLIERAADEATQTDRVIEAVARYRDTEGRYRHMLTRRQRELDQRGRVMSLRGVGIDISELAQERERSLSLLERMQMVAETIGVGFWWRDIDAGVFEWDEQMYRMHHRRPEEGPPDLDEWIGRHVHPADRGWMAARQQVHYTQWTPASDVIFRTLAPDGRERWIQSWTRRLVRHGHRVSLGIHVDITERRQAEQRTELERQRDQFAIEAAGIGVWERSVPDARAMYWSPTMYRLRGFEADDPRPPDEIVALTVPPDVAAEAMRRMEHCIRTGGKFSFEFEVTWPDGTHRWLASSGRAVRDAAGNAMAVAGINVDITERRQLEQIARERDRAQQASAAKSELMARVSHELRTPMNAVLGFAELMAHDTQAPLAAPQAERLSRISSAGSHLLGLIDDLLELSSSDQAGRGVALQSVPVADVLREALSWVAKLAQEAGITVIADSVDEAAHVQADPRRLGQVLINLLTNGIKYNRPGGRVWVEVRASRIHSRPAWDIGVHDTGRGLSPQQLERLFEPFNRLGAEREGIPGTGIGLSIVQQLVGDMGGDLAVDSTLGVGSHFSVRLAAADASPAGTSDKPDDQDAGHSAATADRPPLRVLYIEDNPVNEMLVREMLSLRPTVVLDSAPDGQSGIAQALAHPPDLVLLDLQLPDMSGIEVLRHLLGQPGLSQCRFVALSANAMPDDVSQALAAGFHEYWTKPLNLQQFLADIDALAHRLGRN